MQPYTGSSGMVYDSVMWDPDGAGPQPKRLVIGGNMKYAGKNKVSCVAMWDGTQWVSIGTGLRATPADIGDPQNRDAYGEVNSLAVLPNGDLIAAGYISETADGSPGEGTPLGGTPSPDPSTGELTGLIARWNGSAWVPLGTGLRGFVVLAMTVRPNGDLIVTGNFTQAGGSDANVIARWDGTSWHAIDSGLLLGGVPVQGNALATMPNGDVVVAGYFDTAGPIDARNIARIKFNANGTTTWSTLGTGMPDDGYTSALVAQPDGTLVVAGTFVVAGGVSANNIALWNGSAWSDLGAGLDTSFISDALRNSASELVVTGMDSVGSDLVAKRVGATWSQVGNLDANIGGQTTLTITAMSGSEYAVGGDIATGVARFSGTAWNYFGSGFDADLFSVATLANGDVIASGFFVQAGSVRANHLARFNGSSWSEYAGGMNAVADLLAMPNGDVLAAGQFTEAGGQPVSGFAKWNGTTWTQLGSGEEVRSPVLAPNGDVYAAGNFGGAMVGRWNGSSWTPIPGSFTNPQPLIGSWVARVAVLSNGDVIAGGIFDEVDGTPAVNVARWDGTAWHAMGSGLGDPTSLFDTGQVWSVCQLSNGEVLAGGIFTYTGDYATELNGIARWNGSGWQPMAGPFSVGLRSFVYTLLPLANGEALAGGFFTTDTFGGLVGGIAKWDGITWNGAAGGTPGSVAAMTNLPNGSVAVAGNFPRIGDKAFAHFAILGCASSCYSDCDQSGDLNIDDFICFQTFFAIGDSYADCDQSGDLNIDDFICFQTSFAIGC